jgi:ribosome-binding factor A
MNMTIAGHRPERIAEEIRIEVSVMLAGELKDPRLAVPMEITEVRMSPDMKHARIYVNVTGTEAERNETLQGLTAAAGYIRHELIERLRMRRTPEITFVLDQSEEYGHHIDELLRKTKSPEES